MQWETASHKVLVFFLIQCWNSVLELSTGENLPNPSCHFSNHKLVFLQILHFSSMSYKITPLYFIRSNVIYFAQKEPIKMHIFETFQCSGQNLLNSCHFWNNRSVFFQVLHHSLVSWDITPLYIFSWNFLYFEHKKPIMKVQICWTFLWAGKSQKFCTLMDPFCSNEISLVKKVQRSYLLWHWRAMQSLKKNWLLASNVTLGIWWIFTQPRKRLV